MRGRTPGWMVVIGLVASGLGGACQTDEAPAVEAELTAAPEAPHPPGSWVPVPGAQHQEWIDSATVAATAEGILTIRLLRETLGQWRIANVEVRCGQLEGRWRAEERWDGATMVDSSAAPDATDDWIASVPGGPRRVVFLEACRLAGVPTGPA